MKIINLPKWVGLKLTCNGCGMVMELEPGDQVVQTGRAELELGVHCPGCGQFLCFFIKYANEL